MKSVSSMLLCAALTWSAAANSAAPNYPDRPIRLIVPQSPGGATDLVGRMVAAMLSERLGQSIVVDNRPGAATIVGTDMVAKATPDGYTILLVPSSFVILPSMGIKLPFDPLKDFVPLTTVSNYPNVVVVSPANPMSSIKDLIATAKAKPGALNFSSGGLGTGTHLGTELFMSMAGVKMTHVPYKGGGPALAAVLGGQVDLHFSPMPASLANIKAGKLKSLGVSSGKRSALLPNVATLAEAGLTGYEQITWNGLIVAARTPPAIVSKLHSVTVELLQMPSTHERYAAAGLEPGGMSSKDFAAMIRREMDKWGKLIRDLGIKPEA
jgi:tripartite-type tricarboxylate transporter receptor subunit TctC